MERRTVRGENTHPQWHRSQAMGSAIRLSCDCGAIVYEGKKVNFSRVSCPKCKKIHEVPKEMRK
jgi:hypothetical protein